MAHRVGGGRGSRRNLSGVCRTRAEHRPVQRARLHGRHFGLWRRWRSGLHARDQLFFDTLVVWDWSGFDMPATWALRYMYMTYCPGVPTAPGNLAIAASIAYTWYTVP